MVAVWCSVVPILVVEEDNTVVVGRSGELSWPGGLSSLNDILLQLDNECAVKRLSVGQSHCRSSDP